MKRIHPLEAQRLREAALHRQTLGEVDTDRADAWLSLAIDDGAYTSIRHSLS